MRAKDKFVPLYEAAFDFLFQKRLRKWSLEMFKVAERSPLFVCEESIIIPGCVSRKFPSVLRSFYMQRCSCDITLQRVSNMP